MLPFGSVSRALVCVAKTQHGCSSYKFKTFNPKYLLPISVENASCETVFTERLSNFL